MKRLAQLTAAFCAVATVASAATPPGGVTIAVIGQIDPNDVLPNFNIAPNAGTANISIAVPLRVIYHGSQYAVSVGSQNLNFGGGCITSYSLFGTVDGKSKLISSGHTGAYSCKKQDYWLYYFITPVIPDYVGPATLIGYAHYGKTIEKLSVPLTIY
jgi:hypothetical protein